MQKKKKNSKFIIIIGLVIVSLIAIIGGIFLFARPNSTPKVKNERKEKKLDLEKNLLEKRLELQKFFVFNLHKEVKLGTNFSVDGQNINNPFVRQLNSSLVTDLTKLLGQKKDLIIFAGTNKDTPSLEWADSKLDEKIRKGTETYVIFDKTKINAVDCAFFRKETSFSTAFTLAVLVEPEVKILSGKQKAIEFLKKNDPVFTAKEEESQKPREPNPQTPPALFPPKPEDNQPNKPQNPQPSPPNQPNSPSENPKKILAQQIKTDLENDSARIKNNEKPLLRYKVNSDVDNINIQDEKNSGSTRVFSYKGFLPNLEKEDYEEIVNLINDFNQLKELKKKEKEEEIKSKLEEEKKQKLFIFNGKGRMIISGTPSRDFYYVFYKAAAENKGEEMLLWFPFNHSALNGFEDNSKIGNFYLIDGLEKIPTQPHHISKFKNPCKYPKLEDKIAISPYDS